MPLHPEDPNPVLADHKNSAFNAFLMMRFADRTANQEIRQALEKALARYAIHVLRADQKAHSSSLWDNVRHYMNACDLGVAVFEQLVESDYNPNVSLELGYMLAQGKKLLLLKERSLPRLPSDLVGHLYKGFDASDIEQTISKASLEWLRDIGVAKSPSQKLVLFVSDGGTCRCAMSKVVARKVFEGRSLPFALRFESMAAVYGNSVHASGGARRAIQEAYSLDLLDSHRVMKRNVGIITDADLILVMEDQLRAGLPSEKTFLMTEFFGGTGAIVNPWPDHTTGANDRYRECLHQLKALIEPHANRILNALEGRL
jgi:nucleoside 2-deoxyribosyltransferase/protein-tyrosine-phosphatase